MAQEKLTSAEITILNSLVFQESFTKIMEETGQQSGELRDNLINLLNFGLVEALTIKNKLYRRLSTMSTISRTSSLKQPAKVWLPCNPFFDGWFRIIDIVFFE